MPELPEMQALAERLDEICRGRHLARVDALGFSGLASVSPAPRDLVGRTVERVSRRGKYIVFDVEGGIRLLVHLAQAGRVDVERPPKATQGRGAIVRLVFEDDLGLLVREWGHERSARWWIIGPRDDGPLARLGPDADEEGFAELLVTSDDNRRLHTILRDQRFGAGVGRGYADDALNLARLSPFASLRSLDTERRQRLVDAVRTTLAAALELERTRSGGLSAARLGAHFLVHNQAGNPCPNCGTVLERVSYASHEVVYCPSCQTGGKVYADRRLSRLLR